ncbi:DUF4292 domain-containing protein [Chryseobacterium sp. A301]
MKSNIFILSLVTLFLVFGCTSQSKVTNPTDINKEVDAKALWTDINRAPEFETLKISSKINAQTGKFLPTIDATIYLEKDEKVWMNFSALFLSVARGVATPEGFKGYEKWNKTYIDSSYDYLNSLLGVDFIDLQSLQKLLVGKTFLPIDSKDFKLTKGTSSYTLVSKENQRFGSSESSEEYQISLEYASNFDLKKVLLQQINSPNQLEVYYSNFEAVGKERFAKNVKLIIKGKKESQVEIENTKFELTKMSTPYSVPSGYKKVTIK